VLPDPDTCVLTTAHRGRVLKSNRTYGYWRSRPRSTPLTDAAAAGRAWGDRPVGATQSRHAWPVLLRSASVPDIDSSTVVKLHLYLEELLRS
jgi:hypothetical protein